MAFTQTTFLGASIRAFNASIGWGSEPSRMSVSLVEDEANGDVFTRQESGTPTTFSYQGWVFSGLIQNWEKINDINGNPVYEVNLIDPRILLDGTEVIISEYSGPTGGIPNILNVYGYYESIGFGASNSNDSGMPWRLLFQGIVDLINNNPILYKGYRYTLDLTNLYNLPIPIDYRVGGGPSRTVMDMINEICDSGGCEWFLELDSNGVMKVYTISRVSIPNRGVIEQFISSVDGAVSKRIGQEMVFDTTAKFVVGGKKRNMFFRQFGVPEGGDPQLAVNNTVWYYWGTDVNGNVVLGNGFGNYHTTKIDLRSLNIPGVFGTYEITMGEIRAALSGMESWESYLWYNCFNRFLFDNSGSQTGFLSKISSDGRSIQNTSIPYLHSGKRNPMYLRAWQLGLNSARDKNVIVNFLKLMQDDPNAASVTELFADSSWDTEDYSVAITSLFELISSFASEFAGKKIMVVLPSIRVYVDQDTDERKYSGNVVESGYLEGSSINSAISSGLLPPFYSFLNDGNGLLYCYVIYNNADRLDFSNIPTDSIIYNNNKAYIKCSVDPNMVFLNYQTASSPRAVVTLPGIVYEKIFDRRDEFLIRGFIGELYNGNRTSTEIADTAIGSTNPVGEKVSPLPLLPAVCVIPTEDNTLRYGPWYASGAAGKIEFEYDSTMVPWLYNGNDGMNLAAEAKVAGVIGNLQFIESGAVEVPGTPTITLGSQLLQTGPYVTDIQVNIGTDGVKTVYNMKTWTPRFGRLSKYQTDKIDVQLRKISEIRRNFNV